MIMPRNRVDPAEKKKEFVRTAEALFMEKGFEKTSIDDVVERMGVAKGLFYYYFDSKEDLVMAILGNLHEEIKSFVREVMAREGLTAMERFRALAKSDDFIRSRSIILVGFFNQERNRALHYSVEEHAREFMVPMFEQIIVQGVEEGTFDTPYPHETALALIGAFSSIKQNVNGKNDPEAFLNRFRALQLIMERILGAEPGSFKEHFDLLRADGMARCKIELDLKRC
jgi:AcrR family transcriptional regulator